VLMVAAAEKGNYSEVRRFERTYPPGYRPVHGQGLLLARSFSFGSSDASNKNTGIRPVLFPASVSRAGPE
jgi:hypothetical protein